MTLKSFQVLKARVIKGIRSLKELYIAASLMLSQIWYAKAILKWLYMYVYSVYSLGDYESHASISNYSDCKFVYVITQCPHMQ